MTATTVREHRLYAGAAIVIPSSLAFGLLLVEVADQAVIGDQGVLVRHDQSLLVPVGVPPAASSTDRQRTPS
jgi:hypothetical protein